MDETIDGERARAVGAVARGMSRGETMSGRWGRPRKRVCSIGKVGMCGSGGDSDGSSVVVKSGAVARGDKSGSVSFMQMMVMMSAHSGAITKTSRQDEGDTAGREGGREGVVDV